MYIVIVPCDLRFFFFLNFFFCLISIILSWGQGLTGSPSWAVDCRLTKGLSINRAGQSKMHKIPSLTTNHGIHPIEALHNNTKTSKRFLHLGSDRGNTGPMYNRDLDIQELRIQKMWHLNSVTIISILIRCSHIIWTTFITKWLVWIVFHTINSFILLKREMRPLMGQVSPNLHHHNPPLK